ncbi:toprim domain-containing protein [Aurantimonas sp. CSK15Z-1]|nr:toprim domain-containing protein [Aurantimonas sp. CSK15Z-1]
MRLGGEGPVVGIAEGVETALAAHELDRRHPIWAGLSTSGIMTFVPPPFVRRVLIYPDGDIAKIRDGKVHEAPGMRAALVLKERLVGEHKPSAIIDPPREGDYLDALQAVKRA